MCYKKPFYHRGYTDVNSTVTQSPVGSEAEFNQDIVVRFKASERGAAAVINPRYVVKSTGATGA